MLNLLPEDGIFEVPNSAARLMSLEEALALGLLATPGGGYTLTRKGEASLTDGVVTYPIYGGKPWLLPEEIQPRHALGQKADGRLSPLQSYFSLITSRQGSNANSDVSSVPARKHQFRFSALVSELQGLVLDVGCDDPAVSSLFFPNKCTYLGVEPFGSGSTFRLVGLAEMLPVSSNSCDVVVFNTSLDHILDYHTAIEESSRVLKPDGALIVASYAWLDRATLLTDDIHFHHFREFEIVGALEPCYEIRQIYRYEDPKKSSHRYGVYIFASPKKE